VGESPADLFKERQKRFEDAIRLEMPTGAARSFGSFTKCAYPRRLVASYDA
jgi:hypothetical protein